MSKKKNYVRLDKKIQDSRAQLLSRAIEKLQYNFFSFSQNEKQQYEYEKEQ